MLQVANIGLLIFNAWLMFTVATRPAPRAQPVQQAPEVNCNINGVIEMIADLKSDLTMQLSDAIERQPARKAEITEERVTLSVVCIAHQMHIKAGNSYWTYIDTATGKPLFCTPHSQKTGIPTIDLKQGPQDYREDLIEP